MHYKFFKLKPFSRAPKWKGDTELKIRKFPRNLHQFIWFIISLGKFREFYIENPDNGELICSAEAMPAIFIFNFMNRKGIHIGPCYTSPKYRGCGFYPHIVSVITNHYKQSEDSFFIFCSDNNEPSLKGILSMGGIEIGKGYKDKYGIYRLSDKNKS